LDKIYIMLLNYNLGKMTDSLVEELVVSLDPFTTLEVLDASTKKEEISKYATKLIEDNYYGDNFRFAIDDVLKKEPNKYDWFVMMSNDIYNLPKRNWIRELVNLAKNTDAVIVSPSINKEGTSQKNMHQRIDNIRGYRYVNSIDFQCPIIHSSIMKRVIGKWNSDLKYGWGIDSLFGIECYNLNKNIVISDKIKIYHYNKKTFKENVDILSVEEYRNKAMLGEKNFMKKYVSGKFWMYWKTNLRNEISIEKRKRQ